MMCLNLCTTSISPNYQSLSEGFLMIDLILMLRLMGLVSLWIAVQSSPVLCMCIHQHVQHFTPQVTSVVLVGCIENGFAPSSHGIEDQQDETVYSLQTNQVNLVFMGLKLHKCFCFSPSTLRGSIIRVH